MSGLTELLSQAQLPGGFTDSYSRRQAYPTEIFAVNMTLDGHFYHSHGESAFCETIVEHAA